MAKGDITHVDIPADDIERATRFYRAVAGWDLAPVEGFPGYNMFRTGQRSGGGIGQRGKTAPNVLRIYISVDSLEEAVATAEKEGGSVVQPPTQISGMGRYAAVLDTEGNEVGLYESASAR